MKDTSFYITCIRCKGFGDVKLIRKTTTGSEVVRICECRKCGGTGLVKAAEEAKEA